MIFKGCGVNIVTPFTDTNEVDFDSLGNLVDTYLKVGSQAIILGRTTGEFYAMNDNEILEVIDFVVKKVNKKVPVLAQTGLNDTSRSVILSIRAKSLGLDGLILSAPYYSQGNELGLISHFKSIAIAGGLPTYIDNDPARTGLNLAPGLVAKLAEIPNIVGIIESSSDLNHLADLSPLINDNFALISGNDKTILASLAMGASGHVSVLANICPRLIFNIYDKFIEGDFAGARQVFNDSLKAIDLMNLDVNPIPVKTAMNMLGYEVGNFRLPLHPMDPDKAAQVATFIMDTGLERL